MVFCVAIDAQEQRGHHRTLLQGIHDYCRRQGLTWDLLHLGPGITPAVLAPERLPHGIIGAQFFFKTWFDWARESGVPQARVFVGLAPARAPGLARITVDGDACARLAVRHAGEAGYRAAVICDPDPDQDKNHLHRAFLARCDAAGMPVVNLARLATEPLAPARLLELQFAYLAGLDRPTIFLCKNDKTATWWRDAAAMRGIGIPDPLGIIGVGDNPVLTEDRSLDLTSVLLPDRHLGLLAARHLHRLLCGDPAPEGETVVAPLRVVERATTRLRPPRSPAVAQAIAAMRHHLARPLDQRALAAAVGCSHWQLWRAFTREVGCAPKAYQVRLRLARAEELLRTTDLPPAEVAARCGYASARTLRLPFARRYGRAPRAYRRLAGGASRTGGRDLDRAPRGSPGP